MVTITQVLRIFVLGVIRFYQRLISPFLKPSCRFYPTCSAYALQSFQHLGLFKAFGQVIWRLLKCHPWHPGGYDPPKFREI